MDQVRASFCKEVSRAREGNHRGARGRCAICNLNVETSLPVASDVKTSGEHIGWGDWSTLSGYPIHMTWRTLVVPSIRGPGGGRTDRMPKTTKVALRVRMYCRPPRPVGCGWKPQAQTKQADGVRFIMIQVLPMHYPHQGRQARREPRFGDISSSRSRSRCISCSGNSSMLLSLLRTVTCLTHPGSILLLLPTLLLLLFLLLLLLLLPALALHTRISLKQC